MEFSAVLRISPCLVTFVSTLTERRGGSLGQVAFWKVGAGRSLFDKRPGSL